MEKKPETLGKRSNPSNGSLYRHSYMISSAAADGVHGTPRSFNRKQQDGDHEKSFRRSRSIFGLPSNTQASSSSSKLKTNTIRRPKTHPELLNRDDQSRHPAFNMKVNNPLEPLSANKLLVNVTVAQSIGPLRLLLSKDVTVEDVIKSTLLLYTKEGRRPVLSSDPASFGLHYSQFSINCLKPADKIKDLGSRKFFLCANATADEIGRLSSQSVETAPSLSSFGREIQKISKATEPWYNKLMGCLLLPPY